MSIPAELSACLAQKEKVDVEQKIVEELLNDKNLAQKTELDRPIRWVALNTVKNFLEARELPNAAAVLDDFIDIAFKFLISKERKGRAEYIQALQIMHTVSEKSEKESITSMKVQKK